MEEFCSAQKFMIALEVSHKIPFHVNHCMLTAPGRLLIEIVRILPKLQI